MRNSLADIWCGLGRYEGRGVSRKSLLRLAGAQAAAWALAAGGCSAGHRDRAPEELRDYTCLAFNESPLGPSEPVLDAIRAAIHRPLDVAGINRYPDFLCLDLLDAIGKRNGLGLLNVVTGCGSSEIMNIAVAAFLRTGDDCILGSPTFDLIADRARAWGASVRRVPLAQDDRYDLKGILDSLRPETRLIYICNPNNPTGTVLGRLEVAEFLKRLRATHPETIVLFDEAYRDYVEDAHLPDLARAIAEPDGERIVVARSFSKAHGLAGLRAGYALAGQKTVDEMSGLFTGNFGGPLGWRHPEGNINRLAEAAVLASLSDPTDHLERVRALNAEAKQFLYQLFDRLGLAYIRSQANFVMVDTGKDGTAVKEALCARGTLVQAGGDYDPRYASFLRVSTGTAEEMALFAAALEKSLDDLSPPGRADCPATSHFGF